MRFAILLSLAVLALPGCGGVLDPSDHGAMDHDGAMDHGEAQGHMSEMMGSGRDADIAFSREMIPHHRQAVEMSDLALEPARGASPEVRDLAERIRAAQAPEIAQMETWLAAWGVDPDGGMHHGGDDMAAMGMMSDAQLDDLAAARADEFDRLWLEGMIVHHQGAIMMAQHVRARGDDPEVRALADSIVDSQQREIDEMRALLG